MSISNPFDVKGKWYKGNLHTHTNNSDGDLPPAEMVEQYRAAGYDFVCITDHNKVTDIAKLSQKDFLVMHGVEYGVQGTELGRHYHLVAINLAEPLEERRNHPQHLIDAIRAYGGEVILAHPYWSGLSINDMLAIDGYIGVEVFNTSCHYSIAKGYAAVHWDDLLLRGQQIWGFATDDAHWHFNDHRPNDACGAWIMTKAPSLTVKNLMHAITRGEFYASTGPRIENVIVTDKTITVETSEVKAINFIADASRGESFTALSNQDLTHAEYTLRGQEKYVRIECIGRDGKMAWSNAVFVDK